MLHRILIIDDALYHNSVERNLFCKGLKIHDLESEQPSNDDFIAEVRFHPGQRLKPDGSRINDAEQVIAQLKDKSGHWQSWHMIFLDMEFVEQVIDNRTSAIRSKVGSTFGLKIYEKLLDLECPIPIVFLSSKEFISKEGMKKPTKLSHEAEELSSKYQNAVFRYMDKTATNREKIKQFYTHLVRHTFFEDYAAIPKILFPDDSKQPITLKWFKSERSLLLGNSNRHLKFLQDLRRTADDLNASVPATENKRIVLILYGEAGSGKRATYDFLAAWIDLECQYFEYSGSGPSETSSQELSRWAEDFSRFVNEKSSEQKVTVVGAKVSFVGMHALSEAFIYVDIDLYRPPIKIDEFRNRAFSDREEIINKKLAGCNFSSPESRSVVITRLANHQYQKNFIDLDKCIQQLQFETVGRPYIGTKDVEHILSNISEIPLPRFSSLNDVIKSIQYSETSMRFDEDQGFVEILKLISVIMRPFLAFYKIGEDAVGADFIKRINPIIHDTGALKNFQASAFQTWLENNVLPDYLFDTQIQALKKILGNYPGKMSTKTTWPKYKEILMKQLSISSIQNNPND